MAGTDLTGKSVWCPSVELCFSFLLLAGLQRESVEGKIHDESGAEWTLCRAYAGRRHLLQSQKLGSCLQGIGSALSIERLWSGI